MPTGYTVDVVDGKLTDFPSFVLCCARAFGPLVSMREKPMDAPIPETIGMNSYYADKLAETKKEIDRITALTPNEANSAALEEYQNKVEKYKGYDEQRIKENKRLMSMLAKVSDWQPPRSDFMELKKFMKDQLLVSLNKVPYRCPDHLMTGDKWRISKLQQLGEDYQYYDEELTKEREQNEYANAWIKDLRASL